MPPIRLSRRPFRPAVVAAALLGAGLAVLALTDPSHCAWMPKCPLRMLTGYACPGCGLQRAAYALLHGRVAEAWAHNAFLPFALVYAAAVAAAGCSRLAPRGDRLRRVVLSPALTAVVLALFAAWGIARNVWGL